MTWQTRFLPLVATAWACGSVDLWDNLDSKFGCFARGIPGLLAKHVHGLRIQDFTSNWIAQRVEFLPTDIEVNNFNALLINNLLVKVRPATLALTPLC